MKSAHKTERNILIALLLNLSFSLLELAGGLFTNSVAILSDAIHDLGDAAAIGISYYLEKKSKRRPDGAYTYGYVRYSILGAFLTTSILIAGSLLVLYASIRRLYHPAAVHQAGMIAIAAAGVVVNFLAAYFTRHGDSLNQKSVNLHMLEDVLGWAVVLIGSVVIKITGLTFIDPLMSIAISLFILFEAGKNIRSILDLFLEKAPAGLSAEEIGAALSQVEGVQSVHHLHLWSLDGVHHYATLHAVAAEAEGEAVKARIRAALGAYGITHVTIELEGEGETCEDASCHLDESRLSHPHGHVH